MILWYLLNRARGTRMIHPQTRFHQITFIYGKCFDKTFLSVTWCLWVTTIILEQYFFILHARRHVRTWRFSLHDASKPCQRKCHIDEDRNVRVSLSKSRSPRAPDSSYEGTFDKNRVQFWYMAYEAPAADPRHKRQRDSRWRMSIMIAQVQTISPSNDARRRVVRSIQSMQPGISLVSPRSISIYTCCLSRHCHRACVNKRNAFWELRWS